VTLPIEGGTTQPTILGIAVIRLPAQMQLADWYAAIETLIQGLEVSSIVGKLWVIRNNSIQEYQPIVPEENGNE
jgi:hypothetical protein